MTAHPSEPVVILAEEREHAFAVAMHDAELTGVRRPRPPQRQAPPLLPPAVVGEVVDHPSYRPPPEPANPPPPPRDPPRADHRWAPAPPAGGLPAWPVDLESAATDDTGEWAVAWWTGDGVPCLGVRVGEARQTLRLDLLTGHRRRDVEGVALRLLARVRTGELATAQAREVHVMALVMAVVEAIRTERAVGR